MRCWRIDLWRKMASYVQGCLSLDSVRRIEDHLAECDRCRNHLARVMEGNRLAADLPRVTAPEDSWKAIEAAITSGAKRPEMGSKRRLQALGTAAAMITILIFALIWNRTPEIEKRENRAGFDPASYREVPLAQFHDSAEPHVATEGYVSEIRLDEEDGDLTFKLVDDLHRPNHFVVCEIIAPLRLEMPSRGSRIRVYGVSRYDGKADHQWFEVHPVLNIELLR